jgi:hypothetical protein
MKRRRIEDLKAGLGAIETAENCLSFVLEAIELGVGGDGTREATMRGLSRIIYDARLQILLGGSLVRDFNAIELEVSTIPDHSNQSTEKPKKGATRRQVKNVKATN